MPVDEKLWHKAIQKADKAGYPDDVEYIMKLYKEMAQLINPSKAIEKSQTKIKLMLGPSEDFRDVRCDGCGALLYRELIKSESVNRVIEIKCKRCGKVQIS